MWISGEANYSHNAALNVHVFETNLCVSDEMLARLRLFPQHRKVLEDWENATLFARFSAISALAKAMSDQKH
jgi:hypothetical protein